MLHKYQNFIAHKKIIDRFFRDLNASLEPVSEKLILLLERIPNKRKGDKKKIADIKFRLRQKMPIR